MASVTLWNRIEPDVAPTTLTDGSDRISTLLLTGQEARVYDPLWLLGRQWQLGESQGEDTGSPIEARVRIEATPITRYVAGAPVIGQSIAGERYADAPTGFLDWKPPAVPLDVMVEREAVRNAGPALRLATEAGLHLLRLLADASVALRVEFCAAFPLASASALDDPSSAAYRSVMVGRAPDGVALYTSLRALNPGEGTVPNGLPERPAIPSDKRSAVVEVLGVWLNWYESVFSEPAASVGSRAWSSERMEYRCAVSGPALPSLGAEPVLVMPAGRGTVDWHSFDLIPPETRTSLGAVGSGQVGFFTAIPVPVRYPGMPSSRFWELEDARVDLGSVDASDPARLLLVEFGLAYGNDWFVVPVDLPTGGLYRVSAVEVVDTFGVKRIINAADEGAVGARSRLFRLSTVGSDASHDLLFLPPTTQQGQVSAPVEQVRFVRDDGANAHWAIERVIENAMGQPVDLGRAPFVPVQSVGADSPHLGWRLFSELPDYWLPLFPNQDGHLALGSIVQSGGVMTPAPRGQVIPANLALAPEEVGRDGLAISRSYQIARWTDGTVLLWCARRRDPSATEVSNALTYDYLSSD